MFFVTSLEERAKFLHRRGTGRLENVAVAYTLSMARFHSGKRVLRKYSISDPYKHELVYLKVSSGASY